MVLLMPIVDASGMFFPIESMPKVLQYVSAIIPTRYYTSAMRKLMDYGGGSKTSDARDDSLNLYAYRPARTIARHV